MSSSIENLATKAAAEPEKVVGAVAAVAAAAPVLVPVAMIGAAGYGVYKLISKIKNA